ncbi:MAG: hypothetical protein ABI665_14610 [Vicinamibacterales bacterium]
MIVNFVHEPTEALEGVLWSSRGPWLTLRAVSALKAGQPAAPMLPGDVLIHRDRIAFLQVLP